LLQLQDPFGAEAGLQPGAPAAEALLLLEGYFMANTLFNLRPGDALARSKAESLQDEAVLKPYAGSRAIFDAVCHAQIGAAGADIIRAGGYVDRGLFGGAQPGRDCGHVLHELFGIAFSPKVQDTEQVMASQPQDVFLRR